MGSRMQRRRPLVILVDDEDLVRRYVARMLRSGGFHVVDVNDAGSALALLEKHEESVSLVVSDVTMPGVGGTELAAEIGRRWGNKVPVLLMSGNPAATAPPAPFLEKPFSSAQLLQAVASLLDV